MSIKGSEQPQEYTDGRTQQCFKDECDIQKIMARAAQGATMSHLEKYENVYEDFSEFDFFEQTQMLTRGREIFDDLDAELRQEFGQSPAKFFAYVNDTINKHDLRNKLPALAKPGRQLPHTSPLNADEAAKAAASERASETSPKAESTPTAAPLSEE